MTTEQYIDNDTYTTSDMDGNNTLCFGESMNYIPTVEEYREALGGYVTGFVVTGSVTTALLYLLFIHQAWFVFNNSHKVYRRHIYWLISIYPFVTMLSTIAMVVPRAHQLCSAIKVVYMSIGVGHFADLTLLMYGSENKMLYDLRDSKMKLNLLPLCCIYPCLPTPVVNKPRLMLLRWMVWQMKWIQALYFIIMFIIKTGMEHVDGTITPGAGFFWLSLSLTVFNFSSFLGGVWAMNIIGALSCDKLRRFRHKEKGLPIKGITFTVKLQVFILDCLEMLKVFPCLGPILTPGVYRNTLENSLLLIEMIMFGLFSYFIYRPPEFREYEEPVVPTTQSEDVENGVGASVIQATKADSGSSGSESAYGSTASRDTGPAGGGQRGVVKGGWEVLV